MPSTRKKTYTQVRLGAPLAAAVREYVQGKDMGLSEFLRVAVSEKLERAGALAASPALVSRGRKGAFAIKQSSTIRSVPFRNEPS